MNVINSFHGSHSFLSNFYMHFVEFEGEMYPSVEHAYQAAKTVNEAERKNIRLAVTPGQVKKMGRRVTLQPGWDDIKDFIMHDLLRRKFRDPVLSKMLLETAPAKLVEGNGWGDRYWGVCGGQGKNMLGKLLMLVRKELADEE